MNVLLRFFCILLLGGSWPLTAPAQDPPRQDGLFITVPNPITDQGLEQIRQKIFLAVDRQSRSIRTLVFDFNPHGLPAGTEKFTPCQELAEMIQQLEVGTFSPKVPALSTVAFVGNDIAKHTVLPVLACGQLIVSDEVDPETRVAKVRIGNVLRGQERGLTKTQESAYKEVAEKYPSPDLILRMVDKDLLLKRVKTTQGERFMSPERIKSRKDAVVDPVPPAGLEPGKAWLDATQLREFGIAKAIFNSRGEVRQALNLPPQALHEDWLLDRKPLAWRIEVRGPLDAGKIQSLQRRIKNAISKNANVLIFHLDSEAGDTKHVASLANEIRELRDNSGVVPIKTIAWVPPGRSLGAATFIALGCKEIVMGRDSALADFTFLRDEDRSVVWSMLKPLAREQGYPASLFQATVESKLVVYRVKSRSNPNQEQVITEKEFQEDQNAAVPQWNNFGRIDTGGKISASLAREWSIAQSDDINTLEALYSYCNVDPAKSAVRVLRDDWLDQIAEFFREPWVNFLLIMFGIIGLILEVKMPGVTFPGVISAICFVLFFWAYSFVGEFTLLAIFLFILGLALLGVEVLIIPGFAFPGVAGIMLILSSLALVTLDRMPVTTQDWYDLGSTLTTFGLSLVAALVGAFTLGYYLPSIPYASRLVLQPPTDDSADGDLQMHRNPYANLLGAIGVAVTPLRPSGKVQFGDDFLDVIAEGDYIIPGSRVQVIEIEGNRIVVKQV